ncbi:hypothetical protein [Rossellomorea marisflavi]|uniref:hypothetical protein n=1 Tax=Rossellomorea marisflavi TaxID=189381 RepID=UPI003F9F6337
MNEGVNTGMENKAREHVLSVLQKAFDKGQQVDMDTTKMIQWLQQELQSGMHSRGERL